VTRDLDVVLTITGFVLVALWLCVHDPRRRDLRSLHKHDRRRQKARGR